MLGIDNRCDTALLLHFCHRVDGKRGLTRRLRTIDFYHTTTRVASYPHRKIQSDTAGGDNRHIFYLVVA